MNISRQCAHKWWRRYQAEGVAGLEDRSSRPRSCPHQTAPHLERRIVALRQSRKLGPARLAGIVGVPASTVHRVLVRHGLNRLRWMDRPTGRPVRRIKTTRCGELVHIDVKKLARVPPGGGHRMLGRSTETRRRQQRRCDSYRYIHTAIDAYSRLAYSEFAGPEITVNCVAFLDRAVAWFATQGITIERVLTDNGNGYRSIAWRDRCAELGIRHKREDTGRSDLARECRGFVQAIDNGELDQIPFGADHPGDYLRIVRAGPVVFDSITAELRYWVIHNADGLAAVTLTTDAGQTITGTLAWEDIEPARVPVAAGGRTTVVRAERIESFTLHTRRHPTQA